jgi:hypothetical protein
VSPITFGSGKQLFLGLTATGINSVRGALEISSRRKVWQLETTTVTEYEIEILTLFVAFVVF